MNTLVSTSASAKNRIDACQTLSRIGLLLRAGGNNFWFGAADALRRASGAVAVLRRLEEGETATIATPGWRAGNARAQGSVARGHLIGRAFGGPNRLENLVTQSSRVNSIFINWIIEAPIRQHLEKKGCAVCLVAIPSYRNTPGQHPAPSRLTYIIVYTGTPTGPALPQVSTLLLDTMQGNYHAEDEPWRSIGLRRYSNGVGPIN